jgi:malonate-semialdehyde dehydrogenase (acetylating)/methylmalonate-semialdehyde dehydrogenase
VVVGVAEAYRPLRESLLEAAASLRLGYGLEENVDMGPVISRRHRDRVIGYVDAGEREGARLVLDGRAVSVERHPEGNWIGPILFENVTPDMTKKRRSSGRAWASRKPDLWNALSLVQRSLYGNAVSLFLTSGKAGLEFRYRAGIGMIGIKIGVVAPMAFFPFGGSRGVFLRRPKGTGERRYRVLHKTSGW